MRCLIIEDDTETAQYIANTLSGAGHQAVIAADSRSGLDHLSQSPCDLLVLDRLLPGDMDGLALLRTLRNSGNSIPVLILSALATLEERVTGLRRGADDYLTKPFAAEELLVRAEALHRRAAPAADNSELCIADLVLDVQRRSASRGGRSIALQPREFRLLEYLVRHQEQTVSRAMLLENVWDMPADPQNGLIDVHISRLRHKVDRDCDMPLIHTVRGLGYKVSARG